METSKDAFLRRTSSQRSQASTRSHKSGTVRVKPRRPVSTVSIVSSSTSPSEDKSLTSFPSLSPEISPEIERFRNRSRTPIPDNVGSRSQVRSTQVPSTFATLTTSSAFGGRPALFDDTTTDTRFVPGTLHHASDEHLQRLISKNGAVVVVRQLAEDLAQRDSEMSTLRRRADERERELKKMLREVEVSNLDIETRLRNLEKANGVRATFDDPNSASSEANTLDMQDGNIVNTLMNEAMSDTVSSRHVSDDEDLDTVEHHDLQATLKPRGSKLRNGSGTRSVESSVENDTRKRHGASRGWQEYLWGSQTYRKTSKSSSVFSEDADSDLAARPRAFSGASVRRKRLETNLFQPPVSTEDNGSVKSQEINGHNDDSDSHSRKSSMSVSSWTLRLFAGNPNAGRDNDPQKSLRGRVVTGGDSLGSNSRKGSMTAAKASLLRLNRNASSSSLPRFATNPLNRTANGSIRGQSVSARSRMSVNLSQTEAPQSPSLEPSTNLGPVEMDTILPHDTRPPTLSELYYSYHPTDLLVDHFGFIYDQRRRNKQREAAEGIKRAKHSSNVETIGSDRDVLEVTSLEGLVPTSLRQSTTRPDTPLSTEEQYEEKPTKKWQDYLKIATFPTELLSHTPTVPPIMTLTEASSDTPSNPLQISVKKRGSLPLASLNPDPTPSTVVAEFTRSSGVPQTMEQNQSSGPEQEPVKLLLDQLTELHAAHQKERNMKWNEFLRKVRAERKKEGSMNANNEAKAKAIATPEVSIADGEIVGVSGLGNKGKVGRAKWNEFKHLVLGGIPVTYRAKIWAECTGANASRVPGYYADLVNGGDDDPTIISQIEMDIHRTLTDNVFFRQGPGVAKLKEILIAYSRRNRDVGYCQGMNLITASLLLIIPTNEDVFWVLTSIIENILPLQYYDHSLLASRADQQVLRQYVAEVLPRLSSHLDILSIELEALTFQWFLSLFTDCLSAEALYRVWDVVFCTNDGSTFLFQVALALLKINEKSLLECDTPAAVYTYINHQMTSHAISIDGLIQASDGLRKEIVRGELEQRRKASVEKEREIMRQRELAREERWKNKRKGADNNGSSKQVDEVNGAVTTATEEQNDELTSTTEEDENGDLEIRSPVPVED
ncbi:MAG: hypothetical protein M1834_001569 [Cirrosporium novae-zelandiae]|nr:MAG: hypothetical protein M1834_004086 [Cirrosporium novae-zelandiae]KAI9735554.1 MAG: hypothetical protein M1834_001569 [Cirrosporium novae-zelandiae]